MCYALYLYKYPDVCTVTAQSPGSITPQSRMSLPAVNLWIRFSAESVRKIIGVPPEPPPVVLIYELNR